MNKGILLILLIAVVSTGIISSAIAGAFYLIGMGFWGPMLFAFGGINALGYLSSGIAEKRNKYYIQRERLLIGFKESQQYARLNCSYCNTANDVKLTLGKETTYKCTQCANNNIARITISSARVTTPVDTSPKTMETLLNSAEEPKAEEK